MPLINPLNSTSKIFFQGFSANYSKNLLRFLRKPNPNLYDSLTIIYWYVELIKLGKD